MRSGISWKVTSILITGIILVLVVSGGYGYYTERELYMREVRTLASQTTERLANNLAYSLWSYNSEEMDTILWLEIVNDNILGVLVRDMDGNVYSGLVKDSSGSVLLYRDADAALLSNAFLTMSKDILRNRARIGSVELFLTDAPTRKHLRGIVLKIVAQTVILAVVVILILSILFDRYIIRRIVRIRDGIHTIKGGDYQVTLATEGQDEISYIAESINAMAKNLLAREQELITSNRDIRGLQQYLTDIIESLPSLLVSVDRDGAITQLNSAAARAAAIDKEKAVGMMVWELIPELARYKSAFLETIGNSHPNVLLKRPLTIGEPRFFNISIFPLLGDARQGAVICLDDVTEIELKEEQLRQAQKMETIGTLAGGLAHDFNNVLGGIIGTLSILRFRLDKEPGLPQDVLLKYLGTMSDSADRAANIVQQLLVLSRKRQVAFEPVDLNSSVKNTLKICENTFDKAVELKSAYADENAMIMADPVQIEQVLLNLCVNGYHAMMQRGDAKRPGGTLSISVERIVADRHFIKIHPEAVEGEYWALSVRDTGKGIEKRNISKIFDPFFTTKEKGKGTGLGLAVTYNIIHQHNGFINVYSEVGIGTTFNVYFPVSYSTAESREAMAAETVPRGDGLILVVDDEPVMRQTAREILEACGYQVVTAEDGEQGVQVFRQRQDQIRVVLLDMIMPRKSGKDTFKEIRDIDPHMKIILSSGFREDEQVDAVMKIGIQAFIQKPYTLERLSRVVSEVLSGVTPSGQEGGNGR